MPLGRRWIAGVDEAGRGPLAGPVVAAAVILPQDVRLPGLDDSKRLSPEKRVKLLELIGSAAVSFGIGLASAEEIDKFNILEATKLAATRALLALKPQPDFILTDALHLPDIKIPQRAIIKGDQRCRAIAAASVIAKVFRDRLMFSYHYEYPQYGFSAHKGYVTNLHIDSLQRFGPSTIHRLSFRGVCWFNKKGDLKKSSTFLRLAQKIISSSLKPRTIKRIQQEIELVRAILPACEINELFSLLSGKSSFINSGENNV